MLFSFHYSSPCSFRPHFTSLAQVEKTLCTYSLVRKRRKIVPRTQTCFSKSEPAAIWHSIRSLASTIYNITTMQQKHFTDSVLISCLTMKSIVFILIALIVASIGVAAFDIIETFKYYLEDQRVVNSAGPTSTRPVTNFQMFCINLNSLVNFSFWISFVEAMRQQMGW